ncbi:hypothetical protein DL93DRAFT_2174066 [Clavulina sp. PMI_390]|nr:hypothetical protein DL93DRAFT_2174066 [Clavulina sp. PMI_390]
MKFTAVSAAFLALTASVQAAPARLTVRDTTYSDTDILQYALTLEHLENAFYSGALAKYNEAAFTKAGLPSWARGRFAQVGEHEKQHVTLLSGALGSSATAACNYSFPYTDPASFAALSSILEGVGVSAYLGAAGYITDKSYLEVAATILTTEARHQAWVTSAALHEQPWSGPEDTPLSLNAIYTLAAGFITSCPSTNPTLPLTPFPTLTGSPSNAKPGTTVSYSWKGSSNSSATYYAIYYSGLTSQAVQLSGGKAKVPAGLMGTYYTVISTASSNVTDSNTVAGPLISVVNFGSSVTN